MRENKKDVAQAAGCRRVLLFTGGIGIKGLDRTPLRRSTLLAVIAGSMSMLAGCSPWVQKHAYRDYRPAPLSGTEGNAVISDKDTLVGALKSAGYLNPQCFGPPSALPATGSAGASNAAAAAAAASASASAPNVASGVVDSSFSVTVAECVRERNYIVSVLESKSYEACQAHKATMFGNEASWNVALGSLTNVFTGTATVVAGPVGKSIFSALGLFSNAERSLVNEEVYRNMLVPAIGQKIDEIRSNKLSDINAKVKGDTDLTSYPISQAISDVMEYHNDCSFMLGLQMALTDGTSGGVASQYSALKRAEQSIKSDMDMRAGEIRNANKGVADYTSLYKNDALFEGLSSRLKNVEDQLKVIETLPSSKPAGT